MFILPALAERFGNDADAKQWLLGYVQEFKLPLVVWRQASGHVADQIAADIGHLGPRSIAVREVGAQTGHRAVGAILAMIERGLPAI